MTVTYPPVLNAPIIPQAPASVPGAGISVYGSRADHVHPVPFLTDLMDVELTSVESGQVVEFNGTNWVNINYTFDSLNDVVLTTPVTGQTIVFNGTNWVNQTPADAAGTLAGESDVTISSPTNGQLLVYNGTKWTNSDSIAGPVTITGGLTVSTGAMSVGSALTLGGATTISGAASITGGLTVATGNLTISSPTTVTGGVSFSAGTLTFAGTNNLTGTNVLSANTTGTTPAANDNSARFATTAFVKGNNVFPTRIITAAGSVTALSTDYFLFIDKTTGAATPVTLEASPVLGTIHIIKDMKGDAATNNITITAASGNIDGSASVVVNTAYGESRLVFNGTTWNTW